MSKKLNCPCCGAIDSFLDKFCSLMKMRVNDTFCYECQYNNFYEMFRGTNEDVEDLAASGAHDCIFKEEIDGVDGEPTANFIFCSKCFCVIYQR
jgi:hypothetical protein